MSLAGNLGLLGFFKYADFAIMQFNFLGQQFDLGGQIPLLNLALPIGISFYTFHSITYTVSIYRGQMEPVKSFTEYAIFVSFFPQLVAGPILRAKEFLPQLNEKIQATKTQLQLRRIRIEPNNLRIGLTMMIIGFVKKMFFADNISPFVDEIFNNPIGLESFTIILGAIGFGIQIYADFSGYSDIAIGSALILGFKIPINFNKPYFAISPSDFWRRWHISLSTWLRDYLYVPLGGNRKSKKRTYLNLMIVMILGGFWHGAGYNFIIWGILHGTYLSIHKFLKDNLSNLTLMKFFQSKLGVIISIFITQYLVFLAWIPFRVGNVENAIYSMQKYVFLDFHTAGTIDFILIHKFPIMVMALFIIGHYISYRINFIEKLSKIKLQLWFIFLLGSILTILFFYDGDPQNFIYFQF